MKDIPQPIPKYYQIYRKLLDQIESGEFEEKDRFYSDSAMVEKFGVSRGTIREAVKLLIQQGYLVREQGRGTFVTRPPIEQDSEKLMGFTELMRKYDIEPSAKINKKEIVEPTSDLEDFMELSAEDKLVYVVRVRYGNEYPLIIERSYFNYDLFEPIYNLDLESNSIFELLYEHTNIRLDSAQQHIGALSAGESEAELLNINLGEPLLLMKRLIKTKNEKIFQYSEDVYRSDHINFATTTKPYDQYHDNHGLPLELEDHGW